MFASLKVAVRAVPPTSGVSLAVNDASVTEFLNSVADEKKRKDCFEILKLMKQVTKEEPKMWGASIVGFGSYHYKGKSGREGDWFITGISPRKANLSIYIIAGFEKAGSLLEKLGKHSIGKGCLYIKRLTDLEAIATALSGVDKAFAIAAGREVRVLVNPTSMTDLQTHDLARTIATNIEAQLRYPGEIKVHVIRETRAIEFAK